MQNRRDQVQAHRFVQVRMHAALLTGQTDLAEPPLRRTATAMLTGVLLAGLVAAAFGILGVLRPGGKQGWGEGAVLVVEKETGTRYVFNQADQKLHPVLNYASARLILQEPEPKVRVFSRRSLRDVPRGAALGLPGLPDALPAASDLVRGPWTVCSTPADAELGDDALGAVAPTLTVSVGAPPPGKRLGPDDAVLVQLPDGTEHLVWRDARLTIPDRALVDSAFDYGTKQAVQVPQTWINAVPPGPDLTPPPVPGAGQPAPYQVGSAAVLIGQVLEAAAGSELPARYFLVTGDGLAAIPSTAARLFLADARLDDAVPGEPRAIPISLSAASSAPRSAEQAMPPGFPEQPPSLRGSGDPATTVCVQYVDGGRMSNTITTWLAAGVTTTTPAQAGTSHNPLNVAVPPSRAAVIRVLPHPLQTSDALFIVTDAGLKYPVPSPEVLDVLGYAGVDPVHVPKGIADLIPTGPALDAAKAGQPLTPLDPATTTPLTTPSG